MVAAASASAVSAPTVRGSSPVFEARSQAPTVALLGRCSAKALRAARGVTTPTTAPHPASPSVTSTQFCRDPVRSLRAISSVASGPHAGTVARGFMTCATVRPAILRVTPGWTPGEHSARARSNVDRMPRLDPPASRTSRWWRANVSLVCSAWRCMYAAASRSDSLGGTLSISRRELGARAEPLRSQRSTRVPQGMPSEYACTTSFSVKTPMGTPSLSATTADEWWQEMRSFAASVSVDSIGHTTVPWVPTRSATVCSTRAPTASSCCTGCVASLGGTPPWPSIAPRNTTTQSGILPT
mmetsp:Transcript_60906/g.173117  ORF Transcript_60906/g.173117 Transcript_60906/m.173117 type:complete len:298 (-) Transcript_60906:31-924(-)